MPLKSDWASGELFTAADQNDVAEAVNTIVTPEDFGAVGDGTTDDTDALNEMFNSYTITNGGSCILIPYGKVYLSDAIDMQSNTYVFGSGTLKCRSDHGGTGSPGFFLTFKNNVSNVAWIGPKLDINHKVNVNGFDLGQDAPTSFRASEIYIVATVTGSRVDASLEDSSNRLFAGGGKGISIGAGSRNIYANIRATDCDIAAAVETNSGVNDIVENVLIDLQANNSHRTALFINGAIDAGPSRGSLDSGDYLHSVHNGVKVRLRAQGGQDGAVTDPLTSVAGTNYDHVGVVTLDWASGVDLEIYAATPARCTLVRGMASASTIRVNNALLDELQDGWDTRPPVSLSPPGTYMADNVFEANIHAYVHHGVVVRPHRDSSTRTMVKTKLDVSMWCQGGVGLITQSDGTTDEFGASVAYRFRDLRASPVKEIVGISSYVALPTWSTARHYDNLTVDIANLSATGTPSGATFLRGDNTWGGAAPLDATLNAQTGTTYTFVAADDGKVVTASNASAQTYTVPQNSAQAIPVGAYIEVVQLGAGQVTFTAGTGATLNSRGGALKISGQYGTAALRKIATNTFVLAGDLTT